MEVAGIVFIHEQDVVEAAGDHQPRHGAEPAQAALAFIVVQGGILKARGRMPADSAAVMFAIGDIHGAIDHDGEAQTRAGAEFEHAHAAFQAVPQGHQAHAGELRQLPGVRRQVAPAVAAVIKLRHRWPNVPARFVVLAPIHIRLPCDVNTSSYIIRLIYFDFRIN